MKKLLFLISFSVLGFFASKAQTDSTDLMSQLEKEVMGDEKDQTSYTTATFKTTRLIDGHTVENVGKGVLDMKISHRFGKLNAGLYEL